MSDREKMAAWTLSLMVGSFLMIILNAVFEGRTIATVILVVATAVNAAHLTTTYREEMKVILSRMFWKK